MNVVINIAGAILLGFGTLAMFSRPGASYVAREGLRAWYTYAALWICCGLLVLLSHHWWPLVACVALMWLIHNLFGSMLRRAGVPQMARDHIRALGYAYFHLRSAFPHLEVRGILQLLVEGDPEQGIAGRYDEPNEGHIRSTFRAAIATGEASTLLQFVLTSLAVEGKVVPEALNPTTAQRWHQVVIEELERFGITRAEIIAGEVPKT